VKTIKGLVNEVVKNFADKCKSDNLNSSHTGNITVRRMAATTRPWIATLMHVKDFGALLLMQWPLPSVACAKFICISIGSGIVGLYFVSEGFDARIASALKVSTNPAGGLRFFGAGVGVWTTVFIFRDRIEVHSEEGKDLGPP
jgi:hypothetical protein